MTNNSCRCMVCKMFDWDSYEKNRKLKDLKPYKIQEGDSVE